VQTKRLFSDSMNTWFPLRITTHALRCIDKAGGLDNYVLKLKDSELGSKPLRQMKASIKEATASARE
jgi:large subunit ribosomal protein L28